MLEQPLRRAELCWSMRRSLLQGQNHQIRGKVAHSSSQLALLLLLLLLPTTAQVTTYSGSGFIVHLPRPGKSESRDEAIAKLTALRVCRSIEA